MLPVLAMVRLPVTLKTPSTVPSDASATAKVVGTLIVTSAARATPGPATVASSEPTRPAVARRAPKRRQ